MEGGGGDQIINKIVLYNIETVLEEYAARGTRVCYRLEVPPGYKAK